MTRGPRSGDLFAVPLDDHQVGYGLLVAPDSEATYHAVAFTARSRSREWLEVQEVASTTVALVAIVLDPPIGKRWPLVGNIDVDPAMYPLPAYKVGVHPPGKYVVEDYSGSRNRPADATEIQLLPFRMTISPAFFAGALKAWHGVKGWLPGYDRLRPPNAALTSAALFTSPS